MIINVLIEKRKITKYKLSQITQIPYTTINDICSEKTDLKKCSALNVYKIAKALNVPIDSFAIDFEEANSNIFLSTIKSDVENMSKKQLDMLRDSIETIKKYEF